MGKGHRLCATPGCTNIVSRKNKKKGAICSVCERKLEPKEATAEVALEEQASGKLAKFLNR